MAAILTSKNHPLEPQRVVVCDAGFARERVRIRVEQIFKPISPATEIKTI